MTAIGTGYDLDVTTFSPAGRLFQIEYALKAVDKSGTVIGICGSDGVVFAAENIVESKLHEHGTTKRCYGVGANIGIAVAGLVTDGRALVYRTRDEAQSWKSTYGYDAPAKVLQERVASYMHAFTIYGGARPFGVCALVGGYSEDDGAQLYMCDPSGTSWGYHGCAVGKAKQAAQTELEKIVPSDKPVRELVKEAAKIIYGVHDELKDKEFELELSWVCKESNGKHQHVPDDLFKEAEEYAKAATADDDDDDDDDDDED